MNGRAAAVGMAIFALSLAVSSYGRSRIFRPGPSAPAEVHLLTGDEPSYLLMAHSVAVDGDLNLYNNCVARDGRFFGMPKAGGHAARRDVGRKLVYSIHTPGLPVLIAPVYALALKLGVSPRAAVCVFMNFLAALLAVNVWLFCRDLSGGGSPWPALGAVAAVMLTPPVVFYSNLIYPELPAALLILYAFRRGLSSLDDALFSSSGDQNRGAGEGGKGGIPDLRLPGSPVPRLPGSLLPPSLAVAFLPWLSFRFFLPAFVLAAMLVLAARPVRGRLSLLCALPLLASLALFFAYQRHAFGSFNPDAGYIHQHYISWRLSGRRILDGVAGIALDAGHGVLTWSPVYLLSVTGLLLLFRERLSAAAWMIVLLLAVYLPAATFVFWWGGFAPPPRYMVAPAPLLGGALCYALARRPRAAFSWAWGLLLGVSVLVGFLGIRNPDLLYRHTHLVTDYRIHDVVALFPSFTRTSVWTWPLAAFWTAAVLAANLLFFLGWERADAERPDGD